MSRVNRFIGLLSLITAFALMAVVPSCGGGSAADGPPQQQTVTPQAFGLPLPSELTHSASASSFGDDINGAEFITGESGRCTEQGSSVLFSPNWTGNGSTIADLAYALYEIDPELYTGYTTFEFNWQTAPGAGNYWVGLANFDEDRWNWRTGGTFSMDDLGPCYAGNDCIWLAVVLTGTTAYTLNTLSVTPPSGGALTNIFFLHHSTGQGLVDGGMRTAINAYNTANSTSYEFWDHGYSWDGLTNPAGVNTGSDYGGMTDNTDAWDLANLWTSTEADWVYTRNQIMSNHEVIAFKSCYPMSAIPDEDELNYRKSLYTSMLPFFDNNQQKLFVVMSTPPLHPDETSGSEPYYARQFANWLKSADYLSSHPNVVCYDLFDQLAGPDNTLKAEYRKVGETDSHPNDYANSIVGPDFAEFLCDAAGNYSPPGI